MVLTKEELIETLQHEVQILLHLMSKVDPSKLDYRPTPKQRSMLELLQYLSMMGPLQVSIIKSGTFDRATMGAVWGPAEAAAKAMNFDQLTAAVQKQSDEYGQLLNAWTEADFRGEVDMFGRKASRGSLLVNMVVCAHAAYRTQLFCYLKACGRDELNTMNLWAGTDGPV